MSRFSLSSLLALTASSFLLWAALSSVCLLVGTTMIGIPATDQLLRRVNVVLLASLVGAALSSSGVVYQAVLRNPLADPYLLGVASGASLGALLWRFPVWLTIPWLAALGQQAAALIGALVAVTVVLLCSARRGRLEPVTLLLTGVVVSAICSSIQLLLVRLRPELTQGLGGGGGDAAVVVGAIQTNLTDLQQYVAAGTLLLGFLLMMFLSPALSVGMLSDAEAEALGVRIHRLRWASLVTASIVVSAAVAVSGPIAFIGLVCPHIARRLVGPDPRRLLPVATALGAALLSLADALCRLLSLPELLSNLLPVGVITSMLGGPFFLILLLRHQTAVDNPGGQR
jgi:iron complex transport system permease protein